MAETREPLDGRLVARLPGRVGRVLELDTSRLVLIADSELLVVDHQLTVLWRCGIPECRGTHAVARDLSRIALSAPDEVRLLDGRGRPIRTLPHPPFGGAVESGACAFDPDEPTLWAVVPREDTGVDLRLLELDSLRELDRATLDTCPAGLEPLTVPRHQGLSWSIGEGQDGAFIRWSRQVHGKIVLRSSVTDDRLLTAIHPNGIEYLTTPHFGLGPLIRHRLVDDDAIAALEPPVNGFWDLSAFYLDAEHLLAVVQDEDALALLQREPLAVIGLIACPSTWNRWRHLDWAGQGRWLMGGDAGLEMWTLEPPLPAASE